MEQITRFQGTPDDVAEAVAARVARSRFLYEEDHRCDVERVIVKTLEEKPKNAAQWSTRSMAAATGMFQFAISADLAGVRAVSAPLRDVQARCATLLGRESAWRRAQTTKPP